MTDPARPGDTGHERRRAQVHVEVAEILSTYGYVMDDRNWPELDRVFTNDIVFDASTVGLGVFEGLDALRVAFTEMRHPVSHHVTNPVIKVAAEGTATATSKWLAPWPGGKLRSGEYHDEVSLTPDGWRISHRTVSARKPRPNPE